MKTFLHKLIGRGEPDINTQMPAQPDFSPSLYEHHKQALISWIANRLRQLLPLEQQDQGGLNEYAVRMYRWLENGMDVYLKIRGMNLSGPYTEALLAVYEEIKEVSYLFTSKKNAELSKSEFDIEVWEVYRNVIYAATQQKFLLVQEDELLPYKLGDLIYEAPIKERSDIPKARQKAKECLLGIGQPLPRVMNEILLISEAITNVLKHACEGSLSIYNMPSAIHVCITDRGPGFELKLLPYAVLMEGYSTKNSLGQGFTLMMKMADQMLLATSDKGSTIILIFHEEGVKLENSV
ncbi:ATP-binding protein [Paenibacillus physcomitrellae]|uniref:Histidine kinase/HSP90-like ATPase domain-containing protein n=1 Tax=Paenibacillus physcomitrellae TaxID=1619311 RepID=A0ABQ1FTP2_9BACL|nr:ATP-binding protein [Paenibacillus physcomitrellae]GGA29716.1 hypothetical protein GCM10010917_13450 [Paenibacillus physcomitrellae]